MKKSNTSSFQDNIRYMVVVYSLVPVFIVTCMSLLLVVFLWNYTITQQNVKYNDNISQQLSTMYSTYSDALTQMTSYSAEDSKTVFPDTQQLYEVLYQLKNQGEYKNSFYILDSKQGQLFTYGTKEADHLTKPEYFDWGIMKKLKESPGEISTCLQDKKLYIGLLQQFNQQSYYYVFVISASDLQASLSLNSRSLILADSMGWIWYSNTNAFRDNLSRYEYYTLEKNTFTNYNGNRYYITQNTLRDMDINVITLADTENSHTIIMLIFITSVAIFLSIVLITFFSSKKMAVEYTRDIDDIAEAFEQVQNGNLDIKLYTQSSKEFQTIGKDFNYMVDGLKQQIAQNREMAENVAFAQVKQLESQFNPHFLFNTLDNIRFMTKIDIDAADKMIVSLSRLLRYSIRDARDELTVEEDLDNLQSYFNILQIRFNKRFSYDIDIQPSIMQCLIPKLLIQPLIENAVKYGFSGQETLHVSIRGYQQNNHLIFECQDNGAGMSQELLQELQSQLSQENNTSSHMGLHNIHRRIQLMYKEDFGMNIASQQGVGTTIILTMPCKK
ncbi:MAG: histidine kinase [Pseudobutyrivibrio sp.]|nr:histidine kinase [Pseudobutyrivibrio sp.]